MLPASVRGTFADRFDPRLSVILGASIIIHFAIVIVALAMDVETGDGIAERAYNLSFKQETYNVDVEQPKIDRNGRLGRRLGREKAPEKKPDTKPSKKPAGGDDTGRDAKQDVALAEEQARRDGRPPHRRRQERHLRRRHEQAPPGRRPRPADRRRPRRRQDRRRRRRLRSRLARQRRRARRHGQRPRHQRRRRHRDRPAAARARSTRPRAASRSPTSRAFDESTLTPDVVLAKIQSRLHGRPQALLQGVPEEGRRARAARSRCRSTSTRPAARVKGAAHGFAAEVDECIGGQMASLALPGPEGQGRRGDRSLFAITLQLVPD